ncbi:MAG: DUF1761 domain-containing protein [Candidatus Eremiobacteraeota bacterium]|nr:DUF1761 domain-containing protein [Candidatus Eremiobacteraeota bacterium]MBV8654931.1 DUF1761 domain-containing protein [Candidatus Eremiobacteraeota bacterium]
MHRVNWWAILVSAIVFFALGALWYGVLFGAAWKTAMGSAGAYAQTGGVTPYPFVVSFVMAFFLAYGVARVLSWRGDRNPTRGLIIGASLGLLIFGTMTWMDYAFEMRGPMLGFINVGYVVIGMAIQGFILGAWRPRA